MNEIPMEQIPNEIQRLTHQLPVHRISSREMYLFKLKMRLRELHELHWPIIYRYGRKILKYVGVIE